MDTNALGGCLRAWRERLAPAEVGLPSGSRRRTPGLRREELAQLAGVSVDYLARLEQARAGNPSPQVLASLCRALRLSEDEQEHLFALAGHTPPGAGVIDRRLTPGLQRLLDRLADLPVIVYDASWQIVAWNPLAAALVGDPSALHGRERNLAWRKFHGLPSRVVHSERDNERLEREMVADLHAASSRYSEDAQLAALIAELRAGSERFESLWRERPVAVRAGSRKTFAHPQVGRLTLDCDVLSAHGSDLRLVVYSARAGSPDADTLALLSVVGLQDLAAAPASAADTPRTSRASGGDSSSSSGRRA